MYVVCRCPTTPTESERKKGKNSFKSVAEREIEVESVKRRKQRECKEAQENKKKKQARMR